MTHHPMLERAIAASRTARTAYVGSEPPLTDLQIAQAVLRSLLPPSDDVVDAGFAALNHKPWEDVCRSDLEDALKAVIHQILGEK